MDRALYDTFYAIERTHWWPVSMRWIFHGLLTQALGSVARPRILDVGCGTGITYEEFSRHGTLISLDLAWPAVAYTKQRNPDAAVMQASFLQIPARENSFDAVLAFDVIEHVEHDRDALREIHRVLRPNGCVVVNVPAFESLWSAKDDANHHFRRYKKPMLASAMAESGFETERLTYTNASLFWPIWLVRRFQTLLNQPSNEQAEYYPRPWVNQTLIRLLRLEARALKRVSLPFGTSLTAVGRKRQLVA